MLFEQMEPNERFRARREEARRRRRRRRAVAVGFLRGLQVPEHAPDLFVSAHCIMHWRLVARIVALPVANDAKTTSSSA